jgi:hypothetical protein
MKRDEPIPPTRTDADRTTRTATALAKTVEALRSRVGELEAERERLLEENRTLRREITQMRLLDDMKDALEEDPEPPAPPPADALYALLPSSFTFPVFFQLADSRGLDSEETRRCLLHFLAEDRIVQEGPRLVKQDPSS